jgi:hypothetical protein
MTAHLLEAVESNDYSVSFKVGSSDFVNSRKIKSDGIFSYDKVKYQFDRDENKIAPIDGSVVETAVKASPLQPMKSEFPINQRFEFLRKFTDMVLDGETASIIVTGEAALGKSYSVLEALAQRGWVQDEDYVIIKGYATPKALYATLHEYNGKTIVFDDCDSVLKDPTAINLLKGALDSYDKRTISWLTKGFIEDDLPRSFEFTGNVIFVSNISIDKLDDAVKSRSLCIDLSMSMDDKVDRMRFILPKILPRMDMEIKEAALNFMIENADVAREFNMRTLQKASKVIKVYGLEDYEWKNAVKYLLTSV